ncbi:hypothetical protein GCM10010400_12540 [Streptomyces aculeolatus]
MARSAYALAWSVCPAARSAPTSAPYAKGSWCGRPSPLPRGSTSSPQARYALGVLARPAQLLGVHVEMVDEVLRGCPAPRRWQASARAPSSWEAGRGPGAPAAR